MTSEIWVIVGIIGIICYAITAYNIYRTIKDRQEFLSEVNKIIMGE